MKTEHQHSAGGVVARGAEILLISTQDGRRWQLPKGHIEVGESPQGAAMREIREETGVTAKMVAPLPGIEYDYTEEDRRIHKRVDYFLLEYTGGSEAEFDRQEVSGAAWFTWDTGLERLTFDNERSVVRRAREIMKPILQARTQHP